VIERLVADVARQIRLRRAEFYGLRGLLWGALAAVVPLVLKESLGIWSYAGAAALLLAGAGAGAVWGFLLKLPQAEAARLADRGYGLQDRMSTALEWGDRPDRTPIVDALVADAAARAEQLGARRIIPRRVPREAKFVPVPLILGLVLAAAPPIPLPRGSLPNFSVTRDDDEETVKDRSGDLQQAERRQATRRDPVQRAEVQERTLTPRMGGGGQSQPGDLAAVFKDTSLAGRAPDFNSFLKKGDDRLRMLEQMDRLPDLQSDFTQSQARMVFQKAKALRGGLDPNKKVSPEKLRELLQEMERLGRKNQGGGQSDWSRCARRRSGAATASRSGAAARATGAATSAGTSAARARAGRATRAISPRARGCCRAAARAAPRRATPPRACAATRSTWAWRGNPVLVASRGSTPTCSGVARRCPRACSTWASWGSTGR
jgi:hypothetical protein